ncbi:type III polyketide synthase [Saccharopolyspora antimicrobica]|uniref:type III polyketide synthase n=1 Tax=Saccharopolyspora antimicrobica TaxID=455193 RepID=UPI001476E960|nr:3-oxoacyl-[acyl-carrier-protein] synthase III C-terminal domain-containing protein [Saccharopolyspora antimicrobica]
MVTPAIVGFGSALPDSAGQGELWDGFFAEHFGGSALARRLFSAVGVHRRHTVANPLEEDLSGWTTAARMRRFDELAPPLGHRAVLAALTDAGLAAEDVGLLTVASCTGYGTPGLDIKLAGSLGMRPDLRRLFVGHMGCYAALPALGGVVDFAAARDRPAVLLCLELTSLHIQPPTADPQQIVSHALFGDAAVAVVVHPRAPGLAVLDVAAFTDTSGLDQMTWDITDLGFRMGLSPRVPDVLARHLGAVIGDLLDRNGLGLADVAGWAVHPGGPRILDTVEETLGLPATALRSSREVLAEHGNCSSATLLLVLRKLIGGELRGGGHVVAMAFGPGLTLYAALLRVSG